MTPNTGHLIEVACPTSSPKPYTVNVLIVPEIGSRPCLESWSDGSDCWLWNIIPDVLGAPFVLEFEHHLPQNDVFEWIQITEAGDHLLELLLEHMKHPLFATRPLLVLCHGFGGTIMKRTIAALHDQYDKPQFASLKGIIASIVFFATPHPRFEVPQEWRLLVSVLKSNIKVSKKEANQLLEQAATVADISRRFKESDPQIPILSTYETKPSKIMGSRWALGHEAVL